MEVVQPFLLERMIVFLDEIMSNGKVKINDNYKDFQLYKTVIDSNTIRKYIYIEDEEGFIGETQLTTSTGEVLAIKPVNIQKENDGLVLTFEFTVNIQEG